MESHWFGKGTPFPNLVGLHTLFEAFPSSSRCGVGHIIFYRGRVALQNLLGGRLGYLTGLGLLSKLKPWSWWASDTSWLLLAISFYSSQFSLLILNVGGRWEGPCFFKCSHLFFFHSGIEVYRLNYNVFLFIQVVIVILTVNVKWIKKPL